MWPGAEAHGGCTYCALAALSLMGSPPPRVDDVLEWCIKRETGGFHGRLEKESDSCYAWWVGASLRIASRYRGVAYDLLSGAQTKEFLGVCEHKRIGGFRKLPQMQYPDLLHSYFSIAALSIMGELPPIICELGISVRAWERIAEKGVVRTLLELRNQVTRA